MDNALFNINTRNEVYISNATLARILLISLLIFAAFFLMKKQLS